jgi:hypothetical protein
MHSPSHKPLQFSLRTLFLTIAALSALMTMPLLQAGVAWFGLMTGAVLTALWLARRLV